MNARFDYKAETGKSSKNDNIAKYAITFKSAMNAKNVNKARNVKEPRLPKTTIGKTSEKAENGKNVKLPRLPKMRRIPKCQNC